MQATETRLSVVAHGRGLYPRREGGLVTMEETQFHVDWVKGVTVWLRYG